ncbi:hypothetical protein DFH09DRAFT_1079745 [Mycena vulgaris]|nr:hypothetical protein DFH09DRAFT_1079745 [Mycena vulgaris]
MANDEGSKPVDSGSLRVWEEAENGRKVEVAVEGVEVGTGRRILQARLTTKNARICEGENRSAGGRRKLAHDDTVHVQTVGIRFRQRDDSVADLSTDFLGNGKYMPELSRSLKRQDGTINQFRLRMRFRDQQGQDPVMADEEILLECRTPPSNLYSNGAGSWKGAEEASYKLGARKDERFGGENCGTPDRDEAVKRRGSWNAERPHSAASTASAFARVHRSQSSGCTDAHPG